MEKVRAVVIGYGGMGSQYVKLIHDESVEGMALTGVCCRNQLGQEEIGRLYPDVRIYCDTDDVFTHADEFDAVLIVTPHNTHVEIGKQAAAHGKHILCDKPLGVSAKEVKELIAAADAAGVTLATIFNTRANRGYRVVKEVLESGRLGKLSRAVWVCNTFFRTPVYHNSAPWRSTWKGESGGLLINQCQHFMDIWLWLLGMPDQVDASLGFGKFNDFDVDDDVDLRLIYENGLRGNIISATGETPGTNRLEIWGTNGRLTVENSLKVTLDENVMGADQFGRVNTDIYGKLEYKTSDLTEEQDIENYTYVFKAFAAHLLDGQPLAADGQDGLNCLTLANAAYLSAWTKETVSLPIDDELYAGLLEEKCR